MIIFGPKDQRYKNYISAFIHTFYNPAVYDFEPEFHSIQEFFWTIVVSLYFYFLTIIFIFGAHQGIMANEYAFCDKARIEPAVTRDGNWKVDPDSSPDIAT